MACQKVCKQGRNDPWKPHPYISFACRTKFCVNFVLQATNSYEARPQRVSNQSFNSSYASSRGCNCSLLYTHCICRPTLHTVGPFCIYTYWRIPRPPKRTQESRTLLLYCSLYHSLVGLGYIGYEYFFKQWIHSNQLMNGSVEHS